MRHFRDPKFRPHYDALPEHVRIRADRSFAQLKLDPKHPSLHFKRIRGNLWSVRIGIDYRALAVNDGDRFQWFWIGPHAEYDRLIG